MRFLADFACFKYGITLSKSLVYLLVCLLVSEFATAWVSFFEIFLVIMQILVIAKTYAPNTAHQTLRVFWICDVVISVNEP